jgi:type IV secretory pathway VirJ component
VKRTSLAILLAAALASAPGSGHAEETLSFEPFGTLTLYRISPHPSQVILFVSGDGGWNKGVVDLARELAALQALVVGIDITHYVKRLGSRAEGCSDAAADFEALSQSLQKKLAFPKYVSPVLVGYSSGATLVYAVLAQAPPDTFRGAISLGFCPDLPLAKPLCRRNHLDWVPGPRGKGFRFLPAREMAAPWIALQGTIDQVCDPAATEAFVKQVGRGEIFVLPKVGHGFSVPKNWMPQFKEAFQRVIKTPLAVEMPQHADVRDLPIVEVASSGPSSDKMAIILSGDGGWASLDRQIAGVLARNGIPVVGLDTLRYFWKRRTPEEAAGALERIIRHYGQAWGNRSVVLIGYSLGAGVLPFMANRLPKEMLDRVILIALLGPGPLVDFEFHVTNWLGRDRSSGSLPVRPEVEKLEGKKILCVYGEREKESLCSRLEARLAVRVGFPGAHHFGGNYKEIARRILEEIP